MRRLIAVLIGVVALSAVMGVGVASAQEVVHTVRTGETLSGIAARYGVSTAALAQANGITNWSYIQIGQQLTIPYGMGTSGAAEPSPEPFPEVITYVVQRGDSLNRIAPRFGVSTEAIVAANDIPNPDLIYEGQVLTIPGVPPATAGAEPPPSYATGEPVPTTYIVQAGETLSEIAARFGVSMAALAQANGITDPNQIAYVRVLYIPAVGTGGYTAPTVEAGQEVGTGGPTTTYIAAPPPVVYYTVRTGDTLYSIAARFGVSMAELARVNGITNWNYIQITQVLVIP